MEQELRMSVGLDIKPWWQSRYNENMDRAISRHPVLVTPRIEFSPQYIPELPTITPRTDFGSLPDPCLVDDADDIDLAVDSNVEMMDPPLIDSDESEGELGPEAEKIPKPAGEAGRPASGGYNLETALGWKEVTFNKITVSPHSACRNAYAYSY